LGDNGVGAASKGVFAEQFCAAFRATLFKSGSSKGGGRFSKPVRVTRRRFIVFVGFHCQTADMKRLFQ
jgi:hypothetical protein